MGLDHLFEGWIRRVDPVFSLAVCCCLYRFDPVGDEQVLLHLLLMVVDFREGPLIRVRARYLKVQKSFLRWFSNPIEAIILLSQSIRHQIILFILETLRHNQSLHRNLLRFFLPMIIVSQELWFKQGVNLLVFFLSFFAI